MTISGLNVSTVDNKRVVTFLGKELASFDVISDDYAYTYASQWANLFSFSWSNNMCLSEDTRLQKASNYAWSRID